MRSGAAAPAPVSISDSEFAAIRQWLHQAAGISLSEQKRALVMGRLAARLRHHGLARYGDYFDLLRGGTRPDELQTALDLLTTNETHFFREPKHFDFLRETIVAQHPGGRPFRVWSAASSSGEEPYSIAMTLAAALGEAPWEIVASDLSSRVLDRARAGHYPMARAHSIPGKYLRQYCLKGIGPQEGTFLVAPELRRRVQFVQINLVEAVPELGSFDAIFLRNVMIYFDPPTKRGVVARLLPRLRPGGYLLIGHAESLHGVSDDARPVMPSVYRKP